ALAPLVAAVQPQRPVVGKDPELAYWSRVTQGKASHRGLGIPSPQWRIVGEAIQCLPGQADEGLYFALPLQGAFEVHGDIRAGAGQLGIAYAGRMISLQEDLQHYTVHSFNQPLRTVSINPPLEKRDDGLHFRLVVQQGVCAVHVNGRLIHRERLPKDNDPWLV